MSNDRYNTRNNRKISMMSPVGLASPLGDENRYNDFNSRAFNSPMPAKESRFSMSESDWNEKRMNPYEGRKRNNNDKDSTISPEEKLNKLEQERTSPVKLIAVTGLLTILMTMILCATALILMWYKGYATFNVSG